MKLTPIVKDDGFTPWDFLFEEPTWFRKYNSQLATNIIENDENYSFEINLAGARKENIQVAVKNGYLSVTANCNEEEAKGKYLCRERTCSSLSRSFYIGDCSIDSISAEYQNGILYITVPKHSIKYNNDANYVTIK